MLILILFWLQKVQRSKTEVRVNNKGYLGSRGGVDIAVAMNPQTYTQDVEEISEGGYLLYDSTWKRNFNRDDISIIE